MPHTVRPTAHVIDAGKSYSFGRPELELPVELPLEVEGDEPPEPPEPPAPELVLVLDVVDAELWLALLELVGCPELDVVVAALLPHADARAETPRSMEKASA